LTPARKAVKLVQTEPANQSTTAQEQLPLQRKRPDTSPVRHGPEFLLLVILATACQSRAQTQTLSPADQPSTIRGIVVNSVTGAPISRALVFTPGNHFAMLTDGEGHFEFAQPKVGNVNELTEGPHAFGAEVLLARKPGFLDEPNGHAPVEPRTGAEITLRLLPEAVINGRVISSETDPAPGMNVQILSRQVHDGRPKWVPGRPVRANSNGEFRFSELLPGAYKLMTTELLDNDPVIAVPGGQQYGFPPVYFPGVADLPAAGTIQVTAGQTVQADIPLTRQPYFNVQIPVANAEQDTNLNVSVYLQGHSGSTYALGYDAEKKRIEGMLPNGRYVVEAATGQNSASGQVSLSVSGAPAEGPSLTLIPNNSIPVHVTEQFTATESDRTVGSWNIGGHSVRVHGPRLYLQVSADSADDFGGPGASLRPPTGQNDDSLVLEKLTPGRYWLRVQSSRGYVAAASMGGVDLLRQPFPVAAGSSAPIEITMRDDNAQLDGTVAGIGAPATSGATPFMRQQPQAWVFCIPLPDSPGQFQQIWVSPDGKFNSTTMAPGTYRVLAFANQRPNLPFRDAEAMRAYDGKGQVVHLSAGQKTSVQLQLIPGFE